MKYGILNLLLGCGMAAQAVLFPALKIPLWWTGGCFVFLGLAYLLQRPLMLGKRLDGTMKWWSWLLLLPLHLCLHLVWHLSLLCSREPVVCQVMPGLWISRRLRAWEIPSDVECVVDLTAEFSEPAGVRGGPMYRPFPLLDATAADPRRLEGFLKSLPDAPTLIHCAQGHGRTGMMAAAWLLSKKRCGTAEEAMAAILAVRPAVRLNAEQRYVVTGAERLGS